MNLSDSSLHFVYMYSARSSVVINELAPVIPPHMHVICMRYAGLATSSPMRWSKALGRGSPGLSSGSIRPFSSLLFSFHSSITPSFGPQATNSSRAPSASFSLQSREPTSASWIPAAISGVRERSSVGTVNLSGYCNIQHRS